jgi:hypothetical protein
MAIGPGRQCKVELTLLRAFGEILPTRPREGRLCPDQPLRVLAAFTMINGTQASWSTHDGPGNRDKPWATTQIIHSGTASAARSVGQASVTAVTRSPG